MIHIDPRFSRTSALADLHVPLRAGSDLVLLGALVNYVINDRRWQNDPFFQTLSQALHQRRGDHRP